MRNEPMDGTAVAETHFRFLWVHVHVHQLRVNVEHETEQRLHRPMQHVGIGRPNGMLQNLVADKTAVHKKVLR